MEIMAKKKRYLQKEVKTVEVYRKPTLQEAWEVVSEYMEGVAKDKDTCTFFVDVVASGDCDEFKAFGKPTLTYMKGGKYGLIVQSIRRWKEGW